MRTKILVTAGIFSLLATLLVVMYGYGQHQTPSIKASIDFPFTVEGKVLPAGQYEFVRDSLAEVFRIKGENKNAAVAEIITRLYAGTHRTPEDAHLVFDVVGDAYALSEIWIPGEDGYVMLITKGMHKHRVLNIKY